MLVIKLTWEEARELERLIALLREVSRFSAGKMTRDFTGSEVTWDKSSVNIIIKTKG